MAGFKPMSIFIAVFTKKDMLHILNMKNSSNILSGSLLPMNEVEVLGKRYKVPQLLPCLHIVVQKDIPNVWHMKYVYYTLSILR